MTYRKLAIEKLQKDHATKGRGYYLDDPEQWSEVLAIPEDVETHIQTCFEEQLGVALTKQSVREKFGVNHDYHVDFMSMYHESYS